jgi:hypothetical protein
MLFPVLLGRTTEVPYTAELGPIGALPLPINQATADLPAAPLPRTGNEWTAQSPGIRIALISSGVDTTIFPEALRSRFTRLGSAGDPLGYGSQAASVILQLAPDAVITSIGVYPNGKFHADWQHAALDWIAANAGKLDAVLYALPPSEFLDPISAAMATGEWDSIADAISSRPLPGARGPVFGVSLWPHLRNQQMQGVSWTQRMSLERFAYLNGRWAQARANVQKITKAGVAVVAPAGDLGPGLQTIFGIGNFPEVTTVGGYDGQTVSLRSGSGPSIDGRVKPDLVAPTGIPIALPPNSLVARTLGARKLLDSSLTLDWAAPQPLTDARARPDSTLTSASIVAVAMGNLAAAGIRDVARQRGALTAASVPLPGEPVWRQGAGLLRRIPDAAFANSRPLVLAHADLGAEPDSGAWTAQVPVAQGAAGGATVQLTDFSGTGPDALPTFRTLSTAAEAPPVSAQVSDRGVEVSLPLGDGRYEGGLYCGYTEVSVPVTGGTVEPGVTVNGIPEGTEQVPTCLVQGTRLKGFNFYIHDINAEDLTLGLLPALPVDHSLLHTAMHLLPIDPLSTKLFFRVSGEERRDERGRPYNLEFPNIPPGYYTIRQWSDYGAPIVQTVADTAGSAVAQTSDIGENPAYQSFKALVLSALCDDPVADPAVEIGSPCTENHLNTVFGDENVEFEKPTGGYLVKAGPAELRVVFDYVKKMPGAGVASRYIDLLKYSDFNFNVVDLNKYLRLPGLNQPATSELLKVWKFSAGAGDPNRIEALFNPIASNTGWGDKLGIARYPFNLTTPNYKAHMSLNFSYELENAIVLVVVQMGDSVGIGVLNPQGTFRLPSGTPSLPIQPPNVQLWGRGQGQANFEFNLLPRGAAEGTLWLVVFPPPVSGTLVLPFSTAKFGDMSFELDTWTNTLWPAVANPEVWGPVQGHSFAFDSNYSARQMSDPACRAVSNSRHKANVCEAWTVMVHSPGDDAATYNLVDVASGEALWPVLKMLGAEYYDPRRGTRDFTFRLVHSVWSLLDLERVFGPFKTNGRFWEQLNLPESFLRHHPDRIEVRIEDNVVGRASTLAEHYPGPVQVAPYVPFISSAQVLDLDLNP